MRNGRPLFRLGTLAAACALLVAESGGAYAQQATVAPQAATDSGALQAVTVTGIRASLSSAMDLKRDGQGVVDGINAEEIGKFPDTNLAESLQRISGVSIDRSIGEGSKVTVRGVGPDFNMVLLNGRQMPASTLLDTAASNSRAFDFANLASESISGIEVYKTSRSSTPAGGIGATINIKTARPLGSPSVASIGFKEVLDTSNSNLPSHLQGKNLTPEISGIYSDTFADGKFGIAISASHQERSLGYNQAGVPNGWRAINAGSNDWGSVSNANRPGSDVNLYSTPQNPNYSMTGVQRQRDNGQLTLQFVPVTDVKATVDYTYSRNKVQSKRNDLGVWQNFGGDVTRATWTPGPVAGPLIYTETYANAGDIAMGAAEFATKNENKSTGVNVEWKVSDRLKLEFDTHRSSAESGADSPYGSSAVLGGAQFTRTGNTIDFSRDFPVISISGGDVDPSKMMVTGSSFRNSYMLSKVDQTQVKGAFKIDEDSGLNFGLSSTRVDNRSAYANVDNGSWGGQGAPANYADGSWRRDTLRQYFSKISGSDNPALFNQILFGDFTALRQQAIAQSGRPDWYQAPTEFTTDRRVTEKSMSGYIQYNKDWDTALPMRSAIGVRYEKTDVVSSALVPTATGIVWGSNNEYTVQFGAPGFTTLEGSYSYLLPSLDYDVDLSKDLKFRASYGETIGRPGWGDIQGGQTLDGLARVYGGTGGQGNPDLKPLKSKNIDLSLEWYYAKGSFASIGYFRKAIENYIGNAQVTATPFNLRTPANGLFWNEAVAKGCGATDITCIRNYIFKNKNGQQGVVRGPDDANGNQTGTIAGQAGDPIATFLINTPSNQKSDTLTGWELNVQHMFGNSGFGVSSNYTKVGSGLKFDNSQTTEQFALLGVSDSANLVGFYENDKWSVRAAYNWRGEFLSGLNDGSGANPLYTEAYGQLDMNVSYKWNKNLSLQFEAINLNDGIQRLHGRSQSQVNYVTQTGPRYMFGLRYKL
ncbi:TonB-dependent receptor [Rhodoferax sp. AJA081-3]|nr:TonB-dependent receptor [Rhodoferax sp. AJA081-3]